jgi:sulfur-oxidizing protein SoxX
MRKIANMLLTASSVALLAGTLSFMPTSSAVAADASSLEKGKTLAFDRKKGNCLACHMIAGGNLPGNIGPPLVAMKARFPDRAVLRAQIYDARKKNANTIMIPFGPHAVMSDSEIDLVTDFIHTL